MLIALRRGRLGNPLVNLRGPATGEAAEALLAFVGYHGALATPAGDLPHVDRRLIEIARALATRPRVLLLDEPAAGLMRADKVALSKLIRRIADLGVAVILVEHDMALVMGISDHIVVLDAGAVIAAGAPAAGSPRSAGAEGLSRRWRACARGRAPWPGAVRMMRSCRASSSAPAMARRPVLDEISFGGEARRDGGAARRERRRQVDRDARGHRACCGPSPARSCSTTRAIEQLAAHRIAASGVALVPEGRQVFPELSVRDNIMLGAHTRSDVDREAELEALLKRFPRLRERLSSRAGLLSGGEQQMLAIARGLMAKPRILLLDEPSLGLAPAMINELFDVLAELRDDGVTILLVDQMAALALTVADRGYVLESGRVVRDDTAGCAGPGSGAGGCLSRPRGGGAVVHAARSRPPQCPRSPAATAPPSISASTAARIAEIAPAISTDAPGDDAGGRLVIPGFVDTPHPSRQVLHSRSLPLGGGDFAGGDRRRSPPPSALSPRTTFTIARRRTLEKAIVQGTTRMRTHVEVDPRDRAHELRCHQSAQDATTPGRSISRSASSRRRVCSTIPAPRSLLIAACDAGADLIGGCPYTDSDPHGQIARIFEIARRFDIDIDFHLDFDLDASWMDLDEVCRQTQAHPLWRPRRGRPCHQAVGAAARAFRGNSAAVWPMPGVAVTVLPATDLFLMGRGHDHNVPRGVDAGAPAARRMA